MNDTTPARSRDSLWKILPGLMFYNLIGRHILRRKALCQWIAEGRDPTQAPIPAWISIADVKEHTS